MVGRSLGADMVGDLVALTQVGVVGNLSDGQLLDRFLSRRGTGAEAAFEAIVTRHGPMVLDVCASVLSNPHDAQDAFQATFLILASRAGSIRRRDSLASWLLGVARRVAVRSRAASARRRKYESLAAETRANREENPPETWPELHEEIGRLPRRYQEPVVLCYLQGLTTEAAAPRLGCPHGTVLSRLSRARDRLRGGLTRRGLALPTGLPVAGLSPKSVKAVIPADLLDATVRASLKFAEQPATAATLSSTTAVSLARGVIYAMLITKLKMLGAVALACILLAGSLQTLARQLDGPGGTSKTAGVASKPDDRRDALLHTVDRLQADLDRSVQLNANLQREVHDLRASLEALRASHSAAAKTKAPEGQGKKDASANPQVKQQGFYTQAGDWIIATSARGDKVVAYSISSGETRSLSLRREPVEAQATPIVGEGVIVFTHGRQLCAFSMVAKRWDVVELPEGCSATASLGPGPPGWTGTAILKWQSHIYIYNGQKGKWNHIDIDAITPDADGEGKENAKPGK